jgi:glycosyltransferase involved in cell wall biosynthesis
MTQTTVHLVYPHGSQISCPDAIGRNLLKRLGQHYTVIAYDWDGTTTIDPGPNDVLVGHPHPAPWTCFRRSMKQRGWKRIIALSPYHHGDDIQVAFLNTVLPHCDLYLTITGRYWFNSIEQSTFAHWRPKMVHVDLAVDRSDFPPIKTEFNKPGQRRCVYIGHTGWMKNTPYLSEIAALLPGVEFGWIGSGEQPIEGLKAIGFQNFATQSAQELLKQYDFLVTVGRADANPTTVIEAMAWGLIPVCTPQSGYTEYPGIVNVPLDDARSAAHILQQLQQVPEATLKSMQATNWSLLDEHFNWDRFAQQVITAIESSAAPSMLTPSLWRRGKIQWAALTSPHSVLRPRRAAEGIRVSLKSIL